METTNKQAEDNQALENYSDFVVEEDELDTERLLAQLADLEPPKKNIVKDILINIVFVVLCYAMFIYILDVPRDSPVLILLTFIVVTFGLYNRYDSKVDRRITVLTELVLKLKAKQDAINKRG